MRPFDLIEYQTIAREAWTPRQVFNLWEQVCSNYDRGLIGSYELDEMKSIIWPRLKLLSAIRQAIDDGLVRTKSAA